MTEVARKMNMSVKIAGVEFQNPVMEASEI